jgi:hypothetical protein
MFHTVEALRSYGEDAGRSTALPTSALPDRVTPRNDGDCPTKAAMVERICRESGWRLRTAWPRPVGEHKRLTPAERWQFTIAR